jgi:hypothetical protein
MKKKIRVTAQRESGAVSYLTKDKGKPGKTPDNERWYEPTITTGWKKDMPEEQRRRLVLEAHQGDLLASGRAMMALSNVTNDEETKSSAKKDALYFYREQRILKSKRYSGRLVGRFITPLAPRLTPKFPRLE